MKLGGYFACLVLGLMCGTVASAQSCYESSIVSPTPFMGNDSEVFKLADGSIWEVKYEYEYMYEYTRDVVVCPNKGKLIVGGKQLNVQLLSRGRVQPARPKQLVEPSKNDDAKSAQARQPQPVKGNGPDLIETQIDGEFSGWEGETIFKFTNGQIWQQSSYAYTYSYHYRPKVVIFRAGGGYQMQVEGVGGRIGVTRLR